MIQFVDPASDDQEEKPSEDATEGAPEETTTAKEDASTTEEAGHDQEETPQGTSCEIWLWCVCKQYTYRILFEM